MLIEQVAKLPPLERLLYWIHERESIRRRRALKLPAPWTDDEILTTYRFCNVRRMDDRVSQWLMTNWYGPYRNHPHMPVAAALARHFNLPNVMLAIGFPESWEPERIKSVVRQRKAAGHTVFNGAYMVRGIGALDKTEMVVSRVVQPLIDNPPAINTSSMQKSVEALLPYWGFSSFMAGQVVADLRWALSGTWKDRYVWAPAGPGSLRGLNRLHGRPLKSSIKEFGKELLGVIEACKIGLPDYVTARLEAMDYQNCLCEYDKYSRALLGEGKPKQLYRPTVSK